MIYPNRDDVELKEKQPIEEKTGKLERQNQEDKLLHSVLENDTETVDDGKLLNESFNQGISSFTPDLMFENMTQNYANAERIYGPKLIRMLTGYDASYVKKNIRIPEFQKAIKAEMDNNVRDLQRKDLLERDGTISDTGTYLASLVLYVEELDHLVPKGFGKKEHKQFTHYGDKNDTRSYKIHDRYRDINMKKTLKKSIRRSHDNIHKCDLTVDERKSQGSIEIIYAIDASGSMRGKKIETAKKAGIALAFKAIENRDKVGLIVFGKDIKEELPPTNDFRQIIMKLTNIRASQETNFAVTIEKAIELFSRKNCTKHLILLSDGVPTSGNDPENTTLQAISKASCAGITTSLVGISLDEDGENLARKIVEISQGRLYSVSKLSDIDTVILEDYFMAKAI
ncbi:VWA domain-containing protein [Candidatus Woesearchaeota archaeon]|nr:VWA domain-containing protein [Candidatus Woesearchaeota archaeon]